MDRKVYIVNDSGHDFSYASKYGTLTIITEGQINKFHITEMYRQMCTFLMSSSPDDFILCSGPNIMNAIACSIFASLHGRLNLLIWRAGDERDCYVLRHIKLPRKEEKE